jgi:secretion/DNA translocation related TadE-like protein
VNRRALDAGRDDAGSATVWLVAAVVVLVGVGVAVLARTAAVLGRHRAERTADLVALAGAEQLGLGGIPCAVAARVAAANQASLDGCTVAADPSGRSGTVTVLVDRPAHLPVVGMRHVPVRARAQRLPPDPASGFRFGAVGVGVGVAVGASVTVRAPRCR